MKTIGRFPILLIGALFGLCLCAMLNGIFDFSHAHSAQSQSDIWWHHANAINGSGAVLVILTFSTLSEKTWSEAGESFRILTKASKGFRADVALGCLGASISTIVLAIGICGYTVNGLTTPCFAFVVSAFAAVWTTRKTHSP